MPQTTLRTENMDKGVVKFIYSKKSEFALEKDRCNYSLDRTINRLIKEAYPEQTKEGEKK